MHIVLLSGGSGKRLWPLSNDIRSKQFVKLFTGADGKPESMVQRVYRQIRLAMPDTGITLATSATQRSAIINQLGDKVTICEEPCRRDTFPAIALAAAYLKDVAGVGEDEAVVICPVDPYVHDNFYRHVHEMEKYILLGNANLTLLGITPTYPSEKYGYIIPETEEAVSAVKAYREKPTMEKAKEYLNEGALWNAGVFGCKLSYLLNKAHELIDFKDYRELLAGYENCTKISFDYAVAEKETKIQVISYTGQWRDVGTWNMMAEVMDHNIVGNAMMDETCANTHVINELDMPILCMGVSNCIVAASEDGILVSDKYRSGYMKPYVDKISIEARFAEKSWGIYRVIDEQKGCLTVKCDMRAGSRMTCHTHEKRSESWTVMAGTGRAYIDGAEYALTPGVTVKAAAEQKHRLCADTEMQLLEMQLGEISADDKKIIE